MLRASLEPIPCRAVVVARRTPFTMPRLSLMSRHSAMHSDDPSGTTWDLDRRTSLFSLCDPPDALPSSETGVADLAVPAAGASVLLPGSGALHVCVTPYVPHFRMLVGTCHCGAVRVEVPRRPRSLTDCNCSICRRYGVLWAYYRPAPVRVIAGRGSTVGYSLGRKSLRFIRCSTCGCVTHYERTKGEGRIGVNAQELRSG